MRNQTTANQIRGKCLNSYNLIFSFLDSRRGERLCLECSEVRAICDRNITTFRNTLLSPPSCSCVAWNGGWSVFEMSVRSYQTMRLAYQDTGIFTVQTLCWKIQTQIQSRLYLAVILMQQFHFSFPLRIVRKFGIISSRTLRWKNTQDCLNCFLYAWELEISGGGMRFLSCLDSRHGFYFPLCWSQSRLYRHATVYSECHVSPRLGICNFAFHLALAEWLKWLRRAGYVDSVMKREISLPL